jgi:Mrp family chromosome partitioning ATPase/capsular polysaccharide biosynthesis protein
MFAQAILHRWWLLVLLGATGLLVAGLAATTAPVRYQSTVTLQLNPAARSAFLPYASETTDTSVTTLAASYGEVLRSRAFGDVVVKRLNLEVPPESVAASINSALIPNTNIFRLSFTTDRPDDAQQLAQSIAEIFVSETVPAQAAPAGTPGRLAEMEATARNYPARIETLRQQRDRLDQSVGRGDLSRLAELNSLESRLATLESSYANLLIEINRARSAMSTASILDNATPAIRIGAVPLTRALLFGLASGLALGAGLALLLQRLDTVIRGPADVAASAGTPPLAVVGRMPARDRTDPAHPGILHSGNGPGAEAFRILRANLRLIPAGSQCKTLVVTGPNGGEGTSFVACNLAIAFAQASKRVLLVDASLRKPVVHHTFGVAAEHGFMDALTSVEMAHMAEMEPIDGHASHIPSRAGLPSRGAAVESPVAPWERRIDAEATPIPGILPSGIDGLSLLVAGPLPTEPGCMLASEAAVRLMERLAQYWDIVLFDAAPLLPVADARALAANADGVLIVARAGATRRGDVQSCLDLLEQAERPLVGVVLNDIVVDRLTWRHKQR